MQESNDKVMNCPGSERSGDEMSGSVMSRERNVLVVNYPGGKRP